VSDERDWAPQEGGRLDAARRWINDYEAASASRDRAATQRDRAADQRDLAADTRTRAIDLLGLPAHHRHRPAD
jgi:hypothetical protein